VILGFYAGKSHILIGLGIFHEDLNLFDLHEKSLDLSNYEIFQHKILKSHTFKKSSILIVKNLASCPYFNAQRECHIVNKEKDWHTQIVKSRPCFLSCV
jgi:hypothetical protein